MGSEQEIWAECSDTEEYDKLGESMDSLWSPKLDQIPDLYGQIKKNKILDLEWTCPGRRDPNQVESGDEGSEEDEDLSNANEADDFAFDVEEEPTKPKKPTSIFKQQRTATKKTTTLAGILSNMERHRIIERRLDSVNVNVNPDVMGMGGGFGGEEQQQ